MTHIEDETVGTHWELSLGIYTMLGTLAYWFKVNTIQWTLYRTLIKLSIQLADTFLSRVSAFSFFLSPYNLSL